MELVLQHPGTAGEKFFGDKGIKVPVPSFHEAIRLEREGALKAEFLDALISRAWGIKFKDVLRKHYKRLIDDGMGASEAWEATKELAEALVADDAMLCEALQEKRRSGRTPKPKYVEVSEDTLQDAEALIEQLRKQGIEVNIK